MRHFYKNLSPEEKQDLIDSIAYITAFIAQADGVIDSDEIAAAKKLSTIRSYSVPAELREFYNEVGEGFAAKLDTILADLPNDTQASFDFLFNKLSSYNDILKKTDFLFAKALTKSWRSFAKHVAKSSGGVFGFLSIGKEEAELIDLPMINKIT